MAKELPYFRFTLQEWQNGAITDMPDSAQGVFINVCCFYWANNCEVTEETLLKRFKTKTKTIQKLIKSEVIKSQNGIIMVSFLDKQLLELNRTHSFYSDCGKKGQKAKKSKTPLTPPLKSQVNYKDKDKDKDKDKKKRKHSFEKSPHYEYEKFKSKLIDWPEQKIKKYYESAKSYSTVNGGKYLDWVGAVKAWARKDNKPDSSYQTNGNTMKSKKLQGHDWDV